MKLQWGRSSYAAEYGAKVWYRLRTEPELQWGRSSYAAEYFGIDASPAEELGGFNGAAAVMLRNTTRSWSLTASNGRLQWGRSSYAAEYSWRHACNYPQLVASMGPQQLCCGIQPHYDLVKNKAIKYLKTNAAFFDIHSIVKYLPIPCDQTILY